MAKRWKTIYVRCAKCGQDFNEAKVEFLGIEEDFQGRDVMSFVCPTCKEETKSYRRG